MDILTRQNLPLRIVCEQEIQRMTEDEISDLLGLSKTHQVILVAFDAESGKTQASYVLPADDLTETIEVIADRLNASRRKNAEKVLEEAPEAKTEG